VSVAVGFGFVDDDSILEELYYEIYQKDSMVDFILDLVVKSLHQLLRPTLHQRYVACII